VIAGGLATRYSGIPKGLLEVGGRRILDRVVDTLAEAVGSLPALCANAPDAGSWRPGLAVHPDVVPDVGALGGILTAVETGAPVVCVAWDMPFVPAALVRALAEGLADADVVIPESDSRSGLEPLCAAYGPACGPAIRSSLALGDQRAIGFHQRVRVARLPAATVLMYGDPTVLFFNVNAPEDLQQAEALCRARASSR
jgi:molybdopterin-guanine dinucleotide biosynthesis protein A